VQPDHYTTTARKHGNKADLRLEGYTLYQNRFIYHLENGNMPIGLC